MPAPPPALLNACGLPRQWARLAAWRLLDTDFAQGANFLHTWQAWLRDSARPRMLHYVALCGDTPPGLPALQDEAAAQGLPELAQALAPQWFGLAPGFHRFTLAQGQVLLTLCVGDVQTALREQAFHADAIYLNAEPASGRAPWDIWHFKALARCCRRGTRLAAQQLSGQARRHLAQCGFDIADEGAEGVRASFNPRWSIKHSRGGGPPEPVQTGSCTVVGAGLAGAAVASALARRGFLVLVVDTAPQPAAGASGLPAGLMAPQVSTDDGVRSRLSRAGLRMSLQQARAHLRRGEEWDLSGVLERLLDGDADMNHQLSGAAQDWSAPFQYADQSQAWQAQLRDRPALWHQAAAWVKPAALVNGWLGTEGVRFLGGTQVTRMANQDGQWQLFGEHDHLVAQSRHVVLAGAMGTAALLKEWAPCAAPDFTAMHGQVSSGLHAPEDEAQPPFPVNGHGSFIPRVPTAQGLAWYAGATYEAQPQSPDEAHQANLQKLAQLLPDSAQALAQAMASGAVQAWRGTRCTSRDRLPLVGRWNPPDEAASLWVSTAMGSRGLSLCALCAELLAAQMCGEPLPLEARLARLLSASRDHPPPGATLTPAAAVDALAKGRTA